MSALIFIIQLMVLINLVYNLYGKERETGRGEYHNGAAIQMISNPLVKLFLRALDKTTEYHQNT
jgi:hypothetical protein